jgi:hypothetical protein
MPATASTASRHDRLDRLPYLIQRQLASRVGHLEEDLDRGGQPGGVPHQRRVPALLLVPGGLLGPGQQVRRHQQVQQLQAVVDRPALQVGHRRGQRGQPPLVPEPTQRLRAGRHPVPGQVHDPAARHVRLQVQPPDPGAADLGHPRQPALQAPPGRLRRPPPPQLQLRVPRPVRHRHQALEPRRQVRTRQAGQRRVQLIEGLVPDPGHQPRGRRHAGKQHRVLPQPLHPVGEDRLRPVAGVPRPRVHPRSELVLGLGELPQPALGPDLLPVLQRRGPPLGIPRRARRVTDPQLPRQVLRHQRRHVQRVRQERPQVPHRGELQGEPEAHVIAAPLGDQPHVGVVEVEHPVQLGPRRRAGVPAEHGRFCVSQELHRHASQHSPDQPVTSRK